MNRRGFLLSTAGLALVAACPALAKPISDAERLQAAMATGLIENQSFTLYEPITISKSVVIRNCDFLFKLNATQPHCITFTKTSHTLIEHCSFKVEMTSQTYSRAELAESAKAERYGSASVIGLMCASAVSSNHQSNRQSVEDSTQSRPRNQGESGKCCTAKAYSGLTAQEVGY